MVLISYGLVAQTPIYKFSFNGNVIDDTGNHIFDSGTGLTNITYVNDRFGNSSSAMRMKNKTPIQTNASLTALPQGTNPRSISVWVSYLDMNPANDVVVGGYGSETNSNFCGIYQQDNRVTAFSWTNDVNSPTGERYKYKNYGNNWYHYVLTYDGTTVKVFRNGNLVISDTPVSPWNTNGFRIKLGSSGSTVLAGGEFMAYDDLEVYNTVLTEAQIQAMYTSQNPINTTDLVAYFPFNGGLNSHDGNHTFVNIPTATAGTYSSGYNGQGLMFNGTQGFQNSSIASVMNNNNFTVAFWQKRSQLPASGLAVGEIPVEAFGSLGIGEKFATSAEDLAYLNYTASSSLTSFKPFDKDLNEWYHVAVQFVDLGNVDYMFYYVNGEFVNAVSGVINQNFSLHRFHNLFTIGMGTDNSGNPTVNKAANCEIDELYVFNRVLSVSEIMALRYQTLSTPCPTGNVTVTNQAEVDALASCTSISGFLNINANNAALDLTPLNNLTTINGALIIQGLTNNQLNIFPNLTTVTGSIQIRLNTFTEFTGFNSLTTASNGLQVLQNTNLTSFSGFNSLSAINGSNLGILLNNNLATINAFSNLLYVHGLLIRNSQLTNLSFLSSLTDNGGQLSIENNSVLTSANFTNPVVHCFCTGISGGDYVRISSNPLLTSVGNVTLSGSVLGDPTIEFFQINNNPLLSSVGMSFFGSATSSSVVGFLNISNNSALLNLNFLNNINVTSCGTLNISVMPVSSLASLSSLTSVGTIQISGNTNLTDISALNNVTIANITSVLLNSNPMLATCAVDWICDYLATASPNATITGNATGCESVAIVNNACNASSCPTGSIALSTQAEVNALAACTHITGNLFINGGGGVLDLTPLNNITTIDGFLAIQNIQNDQTNIFQNLTFIGGELRIRNNIFNSISGFSNVTSILGGIQISQNLNINVLSLFGSLSNLSGAVQFIGNNILTNISILNGVNVNNISSVNISNNSLLSTCAVDWVCDYLATPSPNATVAGNATGCENVAAINAACDALSVSDIELNDIRLYPNPVNSVVRVEIPNESIAKIEFYDLIGKQVLWSTASNINVDYLERGVYMVKITTESQKVGVTKLVKN